MGISKSRFVDKDEQLQSHEIEKESLESMRKDQACIKLLLLGAGESGKSTLFKQIIALYGKGFPDPERLRYKSAIYRNTIDAIKTLCEKAEEFSTCLPDAIPGAQFSYLITEAAKESSAGDELSEPSKNNESKPSSLDDFKILQQNVELAEKLKTIKTSGITFSLSPELAKDIAQLWKDPAIRNTYMYRTKYQLGDSAFFYLSKVEELGREDYLPSAEDILRTRVKTTGIIETEFRVWGNDFKMLDVGGQRSERKKWIHCFEGVTAVIFVAALSDFDQTCIEDNVTKRLDESTELFNQVINSQWFHDTAMILFLNKCDILKEKLQTIPYTIYDPDFKDDPYNYDQVSSAIKSMFLAQNKSMNRKIYTHVTCATDTENISHVFLAVKDIILNQCLRSTSLM